VPTYGYKFLIIAIWLMVPVAGAYLLRSDYEQYVRDGKVQRADSQTRADVLQRYAIQFTWYGQQSMVFLNNDDYRRWQRDWRDLVRQQENERNGLRRDTPEHYPNTDQLLNQLEATLADEKAQVELAATRSQQYVKSEDGLLSIQQSAAEMEAAAQYYKFIGAEGVYLLLMEDLGKLEDRFRQLQLQRKQLHDEAMQAQHQADDDCHTIQRDLPRLPEKLSQDLQTTYVEALMQRFWRFDPWAELRESAASVMHPQP
jgi:hypothetical protein